MQQQQRQKLKQKNNRCNIRIKNKYTDSHHFLKNVISVFFSFLLKNREILEPTPLGKIPKEDRNNIACENERAAEKERKKK